MYSPEPPPLGIEPSSALNWAYQEFLKISGLMALIESGGVMMEFTSAPSKPRERQVVFADGTNWNPGNGKGVYCYYNSAWHFLG